MDAMELVSVLTCPSRPQYLTETLEVLDDAGANTRLRHVYSDGVIPEAMPWIPPGWRPAAGVHREGDVLATWRQLTLARSTQADMVLCLEDDVLPAPGAVDLAFTLGVPDHLALVSLFEGGHEFGRSPYLRAGLHEVPVMSSDGKGLRGACALLIPRRSLEWILRFPPPERSRGRDHAISLALEGSPWPTRGIQLPSLFEHIGDFSANGHRPGQRASWWAGGKKP